MLQELRGLDTPIRFANAREAWEAVNRRQSSAKFFVRCTAPGSAYNTTRGFGFETEEQAINAFNEARRVWPTHQVELLSAAAKRKSTDGS